MIEELNKLKVFVSSVQNELEDERLIVQNLLNTDPFLSAHCSPVLYEFEPASPARALDGCLKSLDDCQVYLLMIARARETAITYGRREPHRNDKASRNRRRGPICVGRFGEIMLSIQYRESVSMRFWVSSTLLMSSISLIQHDIFACLLSFLRWRESITRSVTGRKVKTRANVNTVSAPTK